jgi:aspartate/methionine/tyrosine aminotransferase
VPKKVVIEKADRLYQLPPEPASFLPERRKRSLVKKTEVLDLAGFHWPIERDPDLTLTGADLAPADADLIGALKEELANWYQNQFGVRLIPDKEIYIGGSASTLLYALALAFVDHGDIVFVPEIGLPLYRRAAIACGGEPVGYAVTARNNYLPDFERLNTRLGRVARVLFLNSPHNPTGAELNEKDFAGLVFQAGRDNIIVVNDIAYLTLSARKPTSLMSATGGKRIGVEVGSFPYLFGLPRMPLGYVVGNRDVISGLRQAAKLTPLVALRYQVKEALEAIRHYPNDSLKALRRDTSASRAEAIKLLDLLDLEVAGYDTVPFVWGKIERRRPATYAAGQLFRRGRILAVPGVAFGESGEGYLRFSLTQSAESFRKAAERVRKRPRLFKLVKER